jgi:hypothetical protein
MGTTENTITTISPIRHGKLAVQVDLTPMIGADTGTVIIRLRNAIDGVTTRNIDRADFLLGTDEIMPTVEGWVQEGTTTCEVRIQTNVAVLANRTLSYRIIEAS